MIFYFIIGGGALFRYHSGSLLRCHSQLSKKFLAHPSLLYSHNWQKDSLRRYAAFNRLLAFSKVRKKRRSFPESRAVTARRILRFFLAPNQA